MARPQGHDIYLDQSNIGKTPIHSMEVASGTHHLKVKDSETEIYVIPGKSLRLSLFKGTFVEVKEKDTAEKKPAKPTEEKTGYQPKYDPAYWPLKPSGTIK